MSLVPNTEEGKAQDISGVDCLLWAIGRDANAVNLGLDTTGVELDKKGFIKVDEYQNTNVKSLYALGDIAGKALLTPGRWGCLVCLCVHVCLCVCVCVCVCALRREFFPLLL